MPVPPPPPPPPILSGYTKQKSKMTDNRTELLNEIHRGARLKKTITNDRSAPAIGAKTDNNRVNKQAMKSTSLNESLSALFSAGIPRKPCDVKVQKSFNSTGTSLLAAESPNLTEIKFVDEKECVRIPLKSANVGTSLAVLKNKSAMQTTSSAPSLPPPLPVKVLKQNSTIEEFDLKKSKMTGAHSQHAQFQTLRPLKAQPISDNSCGLRRSESNEEIKKPVMNLAPIKRPGAPPPPPPTAKPCNPSSTIYPISQPQLKPQNGSLNKNLVVLDAPLPPPRISSCQESLEQRFHFVPISELPPPPRFIGFAKDYVIAGKRHQQLT